MYRAYLTRRLPAEIITHLEEACRLRSWDGDDPVPLQVLTREVTEVEGLLCMLSDRIDTDLLNRAPKLRVVSQMAVGVDNIDVAACARRGIAVGHTPDVLTETVADHAFALLGTIVRRIPEGEREVRAGEWGPWSPFHLAGGDLHGTTLGIVGMGRIGRAVAKRATGFDMHVVYSSPRAADVPGAAHVSLVELLSRADHVVVCASLNEETHHLIGAGELEAMKNTAYLVNVARGPIVDTEALVDALSSGLIAGAALDVTDPEPLPPKHPLLGLENCLVVPHIASASMPTRMAMARLAADNLLAGLEDRAMPARYGG